MNDIIIRNAESRDLPYIRGIMNDAVLHSTAIYDYNERDDAYVQNWLEQMQQNNMPVIVCESDGSCIAYGCYAQFRPKDGYQFCVEHSIYVHKDFRGKGCGARLLEELMLIAKSQNIHTMIAGIDAENQFSIDFHKKYGFEQTGYLKEVGYKFGRWLDLVFMEKVL